jgi:hypothetical protein
VEIFININAIIINIKQDFFRRHRAGFLTGNYYMKRKWSNATLSAGWRQLRRLCSRKEIQKQQTRQENSFAVFAPSPLCVEPNIVHL